MSLERRNQRYPRRRFFEQAFAITTLAALPKTPEHSPFLNPELKSPILKMADVVQSPDGETYRIKREVRDKQPTLVRYSISPSARARYRGTIRILNPIHIESVPLREPPPGEGGREDPLFIFIPGIKTDEFTETFQAIKDTLKGIGFKDANFFDMFHKTKKDSIRDPNIILDEMDEKINVLKQRFPLRPFWLFGHSQGGWHAHMLTLRHYDSVVGMISLDGALMGVNPTPLPLIAERPIAQNPLVAGASGKFFTERGGDASTKQKVEEEARFLQENGVIYVTFASTDDRLISDKFSFVESSDNTFLDQTITLRFPMGRFLELETVEEYINQKAGGLALELAQGALWFESRDGFLPSRIVGDLLENILGVEVDERLVQTLEETQDAFDRKPLYSHAVVTSDPDVLRAIPLIIKDYLVLREPQIINEVQIDFRGILPGYSTKQDVLRLLGNPAERKVRRNLTEVYLYTASHPNRHHRIYFDKASPNPDTARVIAVIKERLPSDSEPHPQLSQVKPDGKYYPHKGESYRWRVYANQGIAIFENVNGTTIRSLYFYPMSLTEFLQTIAKDLGLLLQPLPERAPPAPQQIGYRGIIPGKTTKDELIQHLGPPAKKELRDDIEIFFYPTEKERVFDQIYLKDSVQYIIEERTSSEPEPSKEIYQQFPEGPDGIVYAPDDRIRWWHVFARQGVAVFAGNDRYAFQVMYFPPMTFEEYLSTVAKDFNLSITKPKPQF